MSPAIGAPADRPAADRPAAEDGDAGAFCVSPAEITQVRAEDPCRIGRLLQGRRRFGPVRGPLLLVAADHPARGALGAGARPMAMADRPDMLERLRTALSVPGVDGVLGTADVLEDLLLLGALEGKFVIASMNRGGLQHASFELDDRFTGYGAEAIARSGFDGGKMLTRIDPDDAASVRTLEASARAVDELAERDLIAMIEPFWSTRRPRERAGANAVPVGTSPRPAALRPDIPGAPLRNDLSPEAVIRSIHVAQGLGGTSARTWLKLPAVPEMEQVMAATTLPTLLLGGDPGKDDRGRVFAQWEHALSLPTVRGLVVGRTLLYPPDDDVAGAVRAAAALVHLEVRNP